MPEIKPFTTPDAEVFGRRKDTIAQHLSRPGNSTPNPPSMGDFPVKVESDAPPSLDAIAEATQPFFSPAATPYEQIEERTANKQGIYKNEESINEAISGKPNTPIVVSQDGTTKIIK